MDVNCRGNRFLNVAEPSDGAAIFLGHATTVVGLLQALIRVQEAGAPVWMIARGLRALADDLDPVPMPSKRWRRRK